MYKPKYFILEEFIDQKTFENTPNWKLWYALDSRILRIADILREEIGSITINNWKWGGNRQWSGLRPVGTPYYSQWSQHSFGRALDLIPKSVTPREARDKLKELMDKGKFKGITKTITCEETKNYRDDGRGSLTWCHVDIRNNKTGYNEFYI